MFDRALVHPDRNDIAPRVGVTWSMTPRMVLRGGWGIFYQQTDRYGSESQLGLNLPQLVDASITANSGADAPAFTFAQGFTPLTPADGEPGDRAVAHPGPEPGHAGGAAVQLRSGVPVRAEHGRRGRVRRQPHPQRPPPAQPQRRHHLRQHRHLPVRAVRLRQRLSRTDRHQRPRRLRRAADAHAAADERRACLHRGLHVEQGARRLPRSPERRRRRGRQRAELDLRDGEGLRAAGVRHPASPGDQLHLRAAGRRGPSLQSGRRGRCDRRRLVGERHPHAQRRPAVHGDDHRPGGHGSGPHRARQLRRRGGAERLQPDARFVDGSGGLRHRPRSGPTATAPTTRCAARDRSR